MVNTPEGHKKAVEKLKARDAEYLEKYGMTYFQYLGRKGGKKSTGKTGFALMDKETHKDASAKGGSAPKCKHENETLLKVIDREVFYRCDSCDKVRKKPL